MRPRLLPDQLRIRALRCAGGPPFLRGRIYSGLTARGVRVLRGTCCGGHAGTVSRFVIPSTRRICPLSVMQVQIPSTRDGV